VDPFFLAALNLTFSVYSRYLLLPINLKKLKIMKKCILALTFALFSIFTFAQEKGDWYVGTGDVANVAWTEWSVSPTIGYGVSENLMVGMSVSQADSTQDMDLDFHARYFYKGYFGYVAMDGLNTDNMMLGAGKMFTFHKSVFVDPKVVYDMGQKTTNLMLGFGLKF
tara:strand:+ start:89 stop:589 length:501 start_codon:yes stop_codon:yes gene_type:complete